MIKKIGILTAGLLAGYAAAATAVVFSDEDGVTADKPYAQSYIYDYGSGASIDTTNVNGARVLDFTAPTTTDGKSGAGFGFSWAIDASYKPKVTSIATYKGVCLAYEADAPFRVDFKQSTITDDNYYGMEMAATKGSLKRSYIAFSALTQSWKSTKTVAWNSGSQLGVQFSFKDSHAKAAKSGSNTVTLHSFTLGDECVTAAPNVTEGFAGYNGGSIDLAEGAVHTMNMAEVFEDADGDDLTITVKIVSENNSVKLVDSTKYDQNSIIKFTTTPNPDGPAKVTLTATDPTKKTATFSFTINTEDTENLPVAQNMEFEVKEDSSYKSTLLVNNLTKICSDADGDAVEWVQLSEPEHGELKVAALTGIFTYTPAANFYGKDSFTYKCVEKNNTDRGSEIGVATITVTNVNDAPVVKILTKTFLNEDGDEKSFGDTLVVDEDFDDFVLVFPKENISITDVDGDDDYTVTGKASGVVTVSVSATDDNYLIDVSAIKDANGVAKVSLVVTDPAISIPNVMFYVKVNPVADAPIAKGDTYEVLQGKNEITAKKGVLANDEDPDGDSTLIAVLDVEPSEGTVVLAEDGSFVYTTTDEDYEGPDAFAYHIENSAGLKSEMAVVMLDVKYRNKSPIMTVDAIDTTVMEDAAAIVYKKAIVTSWATDVEKEALTYSFESKDGKTLVSYTSGILTITPVRNAFGEAIVVGTVTDGKSTPTEFNITVNITPVDDAPVVIWRGTATIDGKKFVGEVPMDSIFTDVDGDELGYIIGSHSKQLDVEIVDGVLKVSLASDTVELFKDVAYRVSLSAYDANDTTKTVGVVFYLEGSSTTGITPVVASAKLNWQGAIQANRGTVSMMDMQGRVMWTRRLPVSESEVRAAAATVQGRKILKVNQQTWTIK